MKKRFMCLMLTVVMLISFVPASATVVENTEDDAEMELMSSITPTTTRYKFNYTVYSMKANMHESDTKNGNLKAIIYFCDGTSIKIDLDNKSNNERYGSTGADGRPPWMITGFKIENGSDDAYCVYRLKLKLRLCDTNGNPTDKEYQISETYYPGGWHEKQKSGTWIESGNKNRKNHIYGKLKDLRRDFSKIVDWENFGKTLTLDTGATYSDTTTISLRGSVIGDYWNGKLGAGTSRYNWYYYRYYPTLSYEVSGVGRDDTKVTWETLTKGSDAPIKETKNNDIKNGFTIDKNKMIKYMDNNGVNTITITTTMTFTGSTIDWSDINSKMGHVSGTNKLKKQYTINRKCFEIEAVTFKSDKTDGRIKRSSDNYYFNRKGNKIIATVDLYTINDKNDVHDTANIAETYTHFNSNFLKNAKVKYDSAQIVIGEGSNKTTISLPAETKGKSISNAETFTLEFPLPKDENGNIIDIDSKNVGFTINFTKLRCTYKDADYYVVQYNGSKAGSPGVYSYFASSEKIDTVMPTFEAKFVDNEFSVNGWKRRAIVEYTPSENLYAWSEINFLGTIIPYISNDNSMKYFFYDKKNLSEPHQLLDQNGVTPVANPWYKAAGGSPAEILVESANEAEVDGVLKLYMTRDIAENDISGYELIEIKLDNQAPRVDFYEDEAIYDEIDGSITHKYNFKIEDASGSGRVYYVFTQEGKMPEFKSPEDCRGVSGELDTTLDMWAFVEQIADEDEGMDATNGTAVLRVEKGENFTGKLYYFTADGLENGFDDSSGKLVPENIKSKTITIENPDTGCVILLSGDASKPQSNYEISIVTDSANTLLWRWLKDGLGITNMKAYVSKEETGRGVQEGLDGEDITLDGKYTLEVTVTSGTVKKVYTQDVVFDNSAPKISFVNANSTKARMSHTIRVTADDASGVKSATAVLVRGNGNEIESTDASNNEIPISIDNGVAGEAVNIMGVESGEYALMVTAIDNNGLKSIETSSPFHIRNESPVTEVEVLSDLNYGDDPLVADTYELKITSEEKYYGTSEEAHLYYRLAFNEGAYSDWTDAGVMDETEIGYSYKFAVAPEFELNNGKNIIYVQTVIGFEGIDLENLETGIVSVNEVVLYADKVSPEYSLILEEAHSNTSIIGELIVEDNMGESFTFNTEEIGDAIEIIYNEETDKYDLVITDNIEGIIYVTDEAGNATEIPIAVTCFDFEGPIVEGIESRSVASGERVDGWADITIYNAVKDSVRFAIIPEAELSEAIDENGNISEYYFVESSDELFDEESGESIETAVERNVLTEDEEINAVTTVLTDEWTADDSSEVNLTYRVTLRGISGRYYVGISASDSLGNKADTIVESLTIDVTDAKATLKGFEISPEEANIKAKVTAEFNVPVYVLPKGRITDVAKDDLTIDETNLEIAKLYALNHETSYSFLIGQEDMREQVLYTVDDIGRSQVFTIDVTDDMVSFGNVGTIKAETVVMRGDMQSSLTFIPFDTAEYPDAYRVIEGDELVSPYERYAENSQHDTYVTLMEVTAPDGCYIMPANADGWDDEEGLLFWEEFSAQYLADSENPDAGYKKLYYMTSNIVIPVYDENGVWVSEYYANKLDRTAEIKIRTDSDGLDAWGSQYVTITNIDNTPPQATYIMDPIVRRDEEGRPLNFTLGDVTVQVCVADPETGVKAMAFTAYNYETDEFFEYGVEFEGLEYPHVVEHEKFTMTINGDDDLKGTKLIEIVFYENIESTMFFVNAGEDIGHVAAGEEGFSIDYINKIDISEDDFTISYFDEDMNPIEEGSFFKEARAVIKPTTQGRERGLYVVNNNGEDEKILNSLNRSFTFVLSDLYGYRYEAKAEIEGGFDTAGGTVEYNLATDKKTKDPVEITITAKDEESGVGSVVLQCGDENIPLSEESEGVYKGFVTKKGNHTITLTDKVGNVTKKSFYVANIDSEAPAVKTKSFNIETRTAQAVIASITYTKPNVVITKVEEDTDLTPNDYSVDTNNSIIRFFKNGRLSIWFMDEYGNEGSDFVEVYNINKTAPQLEANVQLGEYKRSADITFEKGKDEERELNEIIIFYNGITQLAEDEDGNRAKFTFTENGFYTFKIYDMERVSSNLTIEIDGIDKAAPKILSVKWTYSYDLQLENGEWVTDTSTGERQVGTEGGYKIATDVNPVTKYDVQVSVTTNSETKITGNDSSELATTHTINYSDNGMYIFNLEKENGRSDSYGFEVAVIDKEAPVIELTTPEIIFYEREESNKVPYSKDLIAKPNVAFKAYDSFGGGVDLSDRVVIEYNGFNPDDITMNTFDRTKPYTITYKVWDDANNETEATMTVRLIGFNDAIVTVNDTLPDYAGRADVTGQDTIKLELGNFAGVSYAKYEKGVHTMGRMKKTGTILQATSDGVYEFTPTENGWYTFLVQTDKRDYFNIQVFFYK